MENFSVGLLLEAFECERYIPQFTSSEYETLEQCAHLTVETLRAMGIDCDGYFSDGQKILRWAGEIERREEVYVVQELLVSISHTKLSSISSSTSSSSRQVHQPKNR